MNTKLKQRLLGAVIIVALIVIFVPMLFTKHEKNGAPVVQEVPTAPAQPSVAPESEAMQPIATSQPEPMQPAATSQPEPTQPVATPEPTTPVVNQQPAETPAVTPAPVPTTQEVTQPVAETPPPAQTSPSLAQPVQPTQTSPVTTPDVTTPDVQVEDAQPVTMNIRPSNDTSDNVVQPTADQQKQLAVAEEHNHAWVVQMGSFGSTDNAAKLIQKMRAHNFTAFSYNAKQGDKLITKVYVGPVTSRADAEKMQTRLLKEVKAKGFVVKFEALDLG